MISLSPGVCLLRTAPHLLYRSPSLDSQWVLVRQTQQIAELRVRTGMDCTGFPGSSQMVPSEVLASDERLVLQSFQREEKDRSAPVATFGIAELVIRELNELSGL